MTAALVVAVAAFALMEPAVAVTHRAVMHRRLGWAWHRSHHRRSRRPGALPAERAGMERNDLFPAVFALATIVLMAIGARSAGERPLLWAGCGITAYGACYLVVHDGFVHGRLGRLPGARSRYARWVTARHVEHHRTGRAPYGFLLPTPSLRTVSGAAGAPAAPRGRTPSRARGGPGPASGGCAPAGWGR